MPDGLREAVRLKETAAPRRICSRAPPIDNRASRDGDMPMAKEIKSGRKREETGSVPVNVELLRSYMRELGLTQEDLVTATKEFTDDHVPIELRTIGRIFERGTLSLKYYVVIRKTIRACVRRGWENDGGLGDLPLPLSLQRDAAEFLSSRAVAGSHEPHSSMTEAIAELQALIYSPDNPQPLYASVGDGRELLSVFSGLATSDRPKVTTVYVKQMSPKTMKAATDSKILPHDYGASLKWNLDRMKELRMEGQPFAVKLCPYWEQWPEFQGFLYSNTLFWTQSWTASSLGFLSTENVIMRKSERSSPRFAAWERRLKEGTEETA